MRRKGRGGVDIEVELGTVARYVSEKDSDG